MFFGTKTLHGMFLTRSTQFCTLQSQCGSLTIIISCSSYMYSTVTVTFPAFSPVHIFNTWNLDVNRTTDVFIKKRRQRLLHIDESRICKQNMCLELTWAWGSHNLHNTARYKMKEIGTAGEIARNLLLTYHLYSNITQGSTRVWGIIIHCWVNE